MKLRLLPWPSSPRAEQTLLLFLNSLQLKFVFNLPIMNIVLRFDRMHMYLLSRDDTKITLCFNDIHCNGRVIAEYSRSTPLRTSRKLKCRYFLPVACVQGVFPSSYKKMKSFSHNKMICGIFYSRFSFGGRSYLHVL